ncbi:hypothetical protein HF1_03790 [Mycoplasma haemofelis str. Langford 1]|uniref:Uncharacterized protein n=1 Tax=Mycoplasma haemofelis (strain Langford 1) TaxID=941640 RepID=E8ZGW6_MYCHL|nr:hypothetical protein [Mycoplasma haemofelis]CBY92387.1 hypothetical protein HF1_03790 [Mycoplasma haemofelis str. Langford 1]
MSKLALGLAGAGGITGAGGFAAYQAGLFSSNQELLTVRETLSKEGYVLVSEDEKFQEFFKEFKGDAGFIGELNKYSTGGEDLSKDTNGGKGKVALKNMCSSYLNTKDKLDKAIKWCVLRIQDKKLEGKAWRTIAAEDTDQGDWKQAFDGIKTKAIKYGVTGINESTESTNGYPILKKWCSDNKKLPISNKNKTTLDNAVDLCSKTE